LLGLLGRSLCLLGLLLVGCMPSRQEIREAQRDLQLRQTSALDCAREDRCAIASPLRQRAAELAELQPPQHHLRLLEWGQDALLARIHLIRSAQRSIQLQSFIYTEDDAGIFIMRELIAAARRGVRVRVLVDQLFSVDDPRRLAELALLHRNLEIRLYNPTFGEAETGRLQFVAGILCCFTRFNQRMHNKLLAVDGIMAITGGRNIQNRYFDWDPGFNYRDRDLLVLGPTVRAMERSFEAFWRHRLAVPVAALRDVKRVLRRGDPLPLGLAKVQRGDLMLGVSAMAESPAVVRARLLDPGLQVGAVAFYSDLPNKPLERNSREERALSESLRGLLDRAEHDILLQTPYLVLSREAQRQFRALRQRPAAPTVTISTNSLASTDALPVYALSHKYKRRYLREFGFHIHEYKPFPAWAPIELSAARPLDGEVLGAYASESRRLFGSSRGSGSRRGPLPLRQAGLRVGMHAKSLVIDEALALVGTHNFDPRSDWLNTESFVLVRDRAFARRLRQSILRDTRPENAWTIAPRPRPPLLSGLNYSLGKASEVLPLFDIWPWRYATSWDIRPGCRPLPYTDPGFADCYLPVGDFPEVQLGGKSLSTRILTAFGAGLAPIL
jgi:phosphatidylserine/phosphatidylglycerophosphate/cardiolipin synthase-like enzyme